MSVRHLLSPQERHGEVEGLDVPYRCGHEAVIDRLRDAAAAYFAAVDAVGAHVESVGVEGDRPVLHRLMRRRATTQDELYTLLRALATPEAER